MEGLQWEMHRPQREPEQCLQRPDVEGKQHRACGGEAQGSHVDLHVSAAA